MPKTRALYTDCGASSAAFCKAHPGVCDGCRKRATVKKTERVYEKASDPAGRLRWAWVTYETRGEFGEQIHRMLAV